MQKWLKEFVFSPRFGIFLLVLTPLVFWNSLFFGIVSAKTFWIWGISEITFVAFLWSLYKNPSIRQKFTWPLWIFFVYLGLLAISTFTGVYPMNSFWGEYTRNEGLLMRLHLALLVPVLWMFFQKEKEWLRLAFVSVIAGLFVSLFFFTNFISSDNGGSTLGNSSIFGTYLLFELFFSAFLFLRAQTKNGRFFGLCSFIIFVFTLFSTDARAAMIAFLGGVVLYAILLCLFSHHSLRRALGWISLSALFLFFVYCVTSVLDPSGRLHEFVVQHVGGSRFVVAKIAWQAFLTRPWFGFGLENFSVAFLTHYDPCFGNAYCGGNTLFDRAHNIVLDTLVQTGIFGFLGYLSLISVSIWNVLMARIKNGLSPHVTALFIAIIAAYVVQNISFFDTTISLLFFVLLFVYSVIVRFPQTMDSLKTSTKYSLPFIPVLFSCALPFTLFFFVLQPFYAGTAVLEATKSRNFEMRMQKYREVLYISPFGRDIRREYLAFNTAKFLWSFDPIIDAEKIKKQKEQIKKEVDLVSSAVRDTLHASPHNIRASIYFTKILQAYARLYDVKVFSQAKEVLENAIAKHPNDPRFYWMKTSLLLEQGNIDEARIQKNKAMSLNADAKRSKINDFLFAVFVNEKDAMKKAAEELKKIDPSLESFVTEVLSWNVKEKKYVILHKFYSE